MTYAVTDRRFGIGNMNRLILRKNKEIVLLIVTKFLSHTCAGKCEDGI